MEIISHLLAIAGVVLVLVLWYNQWRVKTGSHSKGMLAPEPSGALPIIGHLHQLRSQTTIARTLGAVADKHGPIFKFRFGMKPGLVISSHEAVKECFTTNDRVFATRPLFSQGKYLGHNYAGFAFSPYGSYWSKMRKLAVSELLSNRRLETLKDMQISEVETLVKNLYSVCKSNEHKPVKVAIGEWFEGLTVNIVTKVIARKRYFGYADDGNDGEAKRIGKLIREYMYLAGTPVMFDLIPFLRWIDFQGQVKSMKHVAGELDSLIGSWVEEHIARRLKNDEQSHEPDFIDVMLSAIGEDSMFGYTRETIIKAIASTLILGGSDTISVNLTWLVSVLLNNKHDLKRAQEELDLKVGRGRWVEDYDMKDLVYLQAIIKESLRLYPPIPLSAPHEAMEDCQVCGYFIPKGTRLFVNIWKLHRDPRIWEKPDEFLPERFLSKHASMDVSRQHFEFIPFGSGRRSCPGDMFALQVSQLTLARLLQGFELTAPLNKPVDMTEGLGSTLAGATPLEVVFTPRLSSKLYE
ncbi:cytochrome P450 CYP82D47-like [Juglans microcarpa x Juglans regia]|uniref:cytochrome P450 CYP82D47-like n=1 Tax=Juglans microcarpa x Juglans regia TaxID=2249226 RepID=UPI001B7E3610|nr:cytochrome P450 CYP82D47-like [Juglans microcarpa x Juglans regia]